MRFEREEGGRAKVLKGGGRESRGLKRRMMSRRPMNLI